MYISDPPFLVVTLDEIEIASLENGVGVEDKDPRPRKSRCGARMRRSFGFEVASTGAGLVGYDRKSVDPAGPWMAIWWAYFGMCCVWGWR